MDELKPQSGPQERFLKCSADVAFYGGEAGGGKTFALILEPLRHVHIKGFTALTFRRSSVEIRAPGGLWDASMAVYTQIDDKCAPNPNRAELFWRFPSGALIKFAHLMNDDTVYEYQGTEICGLSFDEITHFSWKQFTYLLSRNRSTCGIKPYVRATCNPDKDSWVRHFLDWWINPDTGIAIPERSGVIRYFTISDNKTIWGDTADELRSYYSDQEWDIGARPRSFTFIPASVYDNKILLQHDPNYISSLKSQNAVERQRLLGGDWNISYSDYGSLINRNDFRRYLFPVNGLGNTVYPSFEKVYFVIDGASKTKQANDYSVIGLFGKGAQDGQYYILDWLEDD